jgi:hypothetical protein
MATNERVKASTIGAIISTTLVVLSFATIMEEGMARYFYGHTTEIGLVGQRHGGHIKFL